MKTTKKRVNSEMNLIAIDIDEKLCRLKAPTDFWVFELQFFFLVISII